MTAQPVKVKVPQTFLFTFTTTDLNLMTEIANHWMKMYACHEIERGEVVGYHFLTVWNPIVTLQKLREKPTFKTDSIQKGGYEWGIGAQHDVPLCVYEIQMLCEMVKAAIECRLNKFLLIDKGVMAEVVERRLTWSWANSAVTIALSRKLELLENFAGLFAGHSAYQTSCLTLERLSGVAYA
ncbi:hypothetical protein [Marinomonas sp. PE14-40]|uniref:hypothetical protein n=1 Tax=Marinomonas sp. PE14-40 TaxID=3060621 RepID=UPI003F6692F5